MPAFRRPSLQLFALLLCATFVLARVGGLHLHRCLETLALEMDVHFADAGVHGHHGPGTDAHHGEADVPPPDATPITPLQPLDLIALIACWVLARLRPRAAAIPAARPPPRRSSAAPWLLRPPLRGPPSAWGGQLMSAS